MGAIGGPHRRRIPFEYERIGRDMYKVVYVCEFRMDTAYMFVEGVCLADFKEGFWIDEDYKFTKGDDCRFWMPPTSIIRVTKEKKYIH